MWEYPGLGLSRPSRRRSCSWGDEERLADLSVVRPSATRPSTSARAGSGQARQPDKVAASGDAVRPLLLRGGSGPVGRAARPRAAMAPPSLSGLRLGAQLCFHVTPGNYDTDR